MSNNIRPKKRKSISRQRRHQTNADYCSLEQRLALTTFLVTSLDDGTANNGFVTLRDAINAANSNAASGNAVAGDADGDVIRFDSSLAGGTIDLTLGQLNITDDLTIQGGDLNITVNGQELSRVFDINSSETVSLGRINVTGGNANIGGGIRASGTGNVIVFGGEYSDNVATGDGGGAIYSDEGNLFVSGGTIFDGNIANGTSGSGGAIFNVGGTAIANDVVFTANVANRAGGAIEITGGDLFLTDTTFGGSTVAEGNIAGPDGSAAPGNGGALHVTAGDTVVVTDSLISNNFAAREGGGLWNQAGTTMFVNGSTIFENNIAAGDGADDGGGAIFNNGGNVVVNGATFNDNTAIGTSGSGGAIFSTDGRIIVQSDSEFSGNLSARAGGAVEIIDGQFFDTNSAYTANDTGANQTANPGNGGAIHITGTATSAFRGTTFTANLASSEGGAVWNAAGSSMFLNDVEFVGNAALGDAADNGGGAIFNNGGDVVVTSSVFTENGATGTSGSGGAIFSVDGQILVRTNSTFTENTSARAGGAVEIIDGEFFDTDSVYTANDTGVSLPAMPGNGGAIHITGTATSAFNRTQFSSNLAGSEGGAVWNAAGSEMFLTNVVFTENVASGDAADNGGGAVFNNGGNVFVTSGEFNDNSANGAAGSGGAIFSTDGRVLVNGNSEFSRNLSARAGGAVELIDGDFFDTDSVYLRNQTGVSLAASPGNGGAIHVTGTATSSFSGTDFFSNRAGSEGGAVWNAAGSTMFLSNVNITGNIASGNDADNGGGGIFNNGGSVFVNNSSIAANSANGTSGSGGGALSTTGVLRFDNSTISGNVSARAGGGVEVIDGRAVFNTVTLDSNSTGVTLNTGPGNGGALHVTGNEAVVTFSSSTISNNSASNEGGGLWNQTGSSLFLDSGTTVTNSLALGVGGGVYNRGFLTALDSFFTDNNSRDDGGGIFNTPTGITRIENSSLTGNNASDDGGGVFNLGNLQTIGSTYENNVADSNGGAFFTGLDGVTTIGLDNFFAGNLPNDQN